MRTPSRYLFQPPSPSLRARLIAAALIALLCAGALYFINLCIYRFFHDDDPLIILLAAAGVFIFFHSLRASRQLADKRRRLAAERAGQNICQFASAFDTRQVDSWVIRAVWNVLREEVEHALPLLAQDRLTDDLDLLDDELDLDFLFSAAARMCGRDLTGIERNPFLPIITARDMVLALNAQPMTPQRRERLFITPSRP